MHKDNSRLVYVDQPFFIFSRRVLCVFLNSKCGGNERTQQVGNVAFYEGSTRSLYDGQILKVGDCKIAGEG